MAQILPRDLPPVPGGTVNPAAANIIDDGSGVFRATPQQIADAGAPINSQAQAEAGLVNTGRMTPLRVNQAIAALGVSQAVLASPTGGGMVGYKADVAAVATDVYDRLRREVWVEDYITDPSIGTDNYPAFAAAIAQAVARGVSTVRFNGRYRTESTIVIPSGIRLIGDGHHYEFDGVMNVLEGAWITYRGSSSNPAVRYGSVQDCELRSCGIDCGNSTDGRTAISIGSDNNPATKALLFERFSILGAETGVQWGDGNATAPLEQCDDITFRDATFHSCHDGFVIHAENAADFSIVERVNFNHQVGACFKFVNTGFMRISQCAAGLFSGARMFDIGGLGPDPVIIEGCQSEGPGGGKFLVMSGNNDLSNFILLGNVINEPMEISNTRRVLAIGNYLNSTIALDGFVRFQGRDNIWDGPKEVAQLTVANGARFRETTMRDADSFNGRWLPVGFEFDNDPAAGGYLNSVSVRAGIYGRTFIPSIADFYYPGFYVLPTTDNGYAYKVTVASSASGTEPSWPTTIGATVTSGGVTFQCVGVSALVKGVGQVQA